MYHLRNMLSGQRTPSPTPPLGGATYWPSEDPWVRLNRFLIFGREDGTYSIPSTAPALDDAPALTELLRTDGPRTVSAIVEGAGKALRAEPALFALAAAASPRHATEATNRIALAALPLVARTTAQLAAFAAYARSVRGWGRAMRVAVARWYTEKPGRELALEMLRHRTRPGWAHRDLIRMAHPRTASEAHNALFRWALEDELDVRTAPALLEGDLRQVYGFEQLKDARDEASAAHLIELYSLGAEAIPPRWKSSPAVWEALLPNLGYSALLGSLGRLTAVGLIEPGSEAGALAVARLLDRARIRSSHVSPFKVLGALMHYRSGCDERRHLSWSPVESVALALETAFYAALDNVKPGRQRLYLAIERSGAMNNTPVRGLNGVTAQLAAAAFALALARTEPFVRMATFSHSGVREFSLTGRERLTATVAQLSTGEEHGPAADPAVAITDAVARGLDIDLFIVMTATRFMCAAAPGRLVTIALGAAPSTSDGGLDAARRLAITGFDASVPAAIAAFAAD
jgi:60 kDa SS-A/Ro ribonucleoprotein